MVVSASSVGFETLQGKFLGRDVVLVDVLLGEVTTTETVTGSEADPTWTYTDKVGHEHSAVQESLIVDGVSVKQMVHYPTLRFHEHTYWCEDCADDHTEIQYYCHWCGENITPGVRNVSNEIVTSRTRTLDFALPQLDFYRLAGDDNGTIVIKFDTRWEVQVHDDKWSCVLNGPDFPGDDPGLIRLNGVPA